MKRLIRHDISCKITLRIQVKHHKFAKSHQTNINHGGGLLPIEQQDASTLIKGAFSKKMIQHHEIIEFDLKKSIDRLQLSLPYVWFGEILKRAKLTFVFDKKVGGRKNKIWRFHYNNDKSSLIQIITWNNNRQNLSVIASDVDYSLQKILLEKLFHRIKVTLSQIELAYDIYPKESHTLSDIKNIICDGLTLKFARGVGFYRELSKHSKTFLDNNNGFIIPDAIDDTNDTLYYGSYHFVRRHINYETGRMRNVSKGLTIYFKPINSYKKEYLRLELRLNRDGIENHLKSLKFYRNEIPADCINLDKFLVYRRFEREKLKGTGEFKKKYATIKRKTRNKSDLCKAIYLKLEPISIKSIRHTSKLNETISNTSSEAAIPIQMIEFKKYFRALSDRVTYFFPINKSKQQLFEDLENGYIRRNYDSLDAHNT